MKKTLTVDGLGLFGIVSVFASLYRLRPEFGFIFLGVLSMLLAFWLAGTVKQNERVDTITR